MSSSDRFFQFVCGAAALVTLLVFLWVHGSSMNMPSLARARDGAGSSVPAPTQEIVRGADHDQLPASPAAATTRKAASSSPLRPAALPASELDPSSLRDAVELVLTGALPDALAAELPRPSEVLVRRDRDGRTVVAAGTHRRYQCLVASLEALDVEEMVAALARAEESAIQPAVSGSEGGGELRRRACRALDELLSVELPPVEPDMVSRRTHWGFADPDLETLGAAPKHLLLMGLDNARTVRAKLCELREALGGCQADAEAEPLPRASEELLLASVESGFGRAAEVVAAP